MGRLYQSSTGIADCTKLSFATWVQIASGASDGQYPLLEFAPANSSASSIYLNVSGGVIASVAGNFKGPTYFDAFTSNNLIQSIGISLSKAMALGTWHFVFLGLSLDATSDWAIPSGRLQTYCAAADATATAGTQAALSGGGGSPVGGSGVVVHGYELGAPCISVGPSLYNDPANPLSGTAMRFAYYQVWFGTYIDISQAANYAKFVTLNGGKGTPASANAASSAFGTPSILFKGNVTKFTANAGNGGAFSKVGSFTNFTTTLGF